LPSRRSFLASLLAAGTLPRLTWADAGNPAYLSAARRPDGRYCLCGLTEHGAIAFELPLPDRGHAAAAHPIEPLAVAFARRPGRFALVLDCVTGAEIARLDAPEGRHFYGHGAFSADGSILYTTENDYEAARGMVGLWDVSQGFRRINAFESGGIGPHDMLRLPGSDDLVIANGGIETHPDAGRAKLNIPVMEPNLTYLAADGAVLDQMEFDRSLHRNSIRHLDVLHSGDVAFAMQWEGPATERPPLLGLHRRGGSPRLLAAPQPDHRRLQGYSGSIAASGDGTQVAITSPRGGVMQVFDLAAERFLTAYDSPDVCGIARGTGSGFQMTTGTGEIIRWNSPDNARSNTHDRAFDNHLVKI